MKEKEAKKLGLNKITIADLNHRLTDLDKIRGGSATKANCAQTPQPPPTESPISC